MWCSFHCQNRVRASPRLTRATVLALVLPILSSAFSPSSPSKVWLHRIQSQPTNVTNALSVIHDIRTSGSFLDENSDTTGSSQEKPLLEALRVCGRCERPDSALDIFHQFPTSETCRTMTISVLGSCNRLEEALLLLEESPSRPAPNIGSYNAAIAACGKAKDWERALQVYHMTAERGIVTSLTCNALLTVLAQRRQGQVALDVFNTMPCKPDRLTYQSVISALSRSGMTEQAYDILEGLTRGKDGIQVTDTMFDMILAALYKESNWDAIQRVERLRNPDFEALGWPGHGWGSQFQHWTGLTKIGKGKDAYWEIASIELPGSNRIVVGVHPHRNPSKNGIQLLFYEDLVNNGGGQDTTHRKKLGYLLMQNNAKRESCLLGMFLQGQRRGQGLSKVCLAVWFWLCLQADVLPTTGIINKPLLALLLEDRFGMVPNDKGGVLMELTSDPDDPEYVQLYAPSRKNLWGVFSSCDVQHQKLRLLKERPQVRGRMITVGAAFELDPGRIGELEDKVQAVLPEGTIHCQLTTPTDFQSLFFGGRE